MNHEELQALLNDHGTLRAVANDEGFRQELIMLRLARALERRADEEAGRMLEAATERLLTRLQAPK